MDKSPGQLIVAATPLGNTADASFRLRELIQSADVVAAEDTRRLKRLAADLDVAVTGRVVSFYESVEEARIPSLLQAIEAGQLVVLVSDAGMPTVSDPGYRLVKACIQADLPVSVAPGPSAVLTALTLSGLATDRFTFEGFLPRKSGERSRRLAQLAAEPRTMVFFEAPHRAAATLRAMADVFGSQREAAACRELTKTYEEVMRAPLGDLVQWAEGGLRGELTVVVGGAVTEPFSGTDSDLVEAVDVLISQGVDKKAAIAQVARELGIPKRSVYAAVVTARHEPRSPSP